MIPSLRLLLQEPKLRYSCSGLAHKGGEDHQTQQESDDGECTLPLVRRLDLTRCWCELRQGPMKGGQVAVQDTLVILEESVGPSPLLSEISHSECPPSTGDEVIKNKEDCQGIDELHEQHKDVGTEDASCESTRKVALLHFQQAPARSIDAEKTRRLQDAKYGHRIADEDFRKHNEEIQEEPLTQVLFGRLREPQLNNAVNVETHEESENQVYDPEGQSRRMECRHPRSLLKFKCNHQREHEQV
mmetsp:Transcript_43495/g.94704  ORF Transcript_43495/g.94704 Transcript_43495/m.94704 type:complete len:244 (+) Transcript_43495:247-978(+)